jgi:hypothetical protein
MFVKWFRPVLLGHSVGFGTPVQWGALIRLEKTENGAKQNSAVKTKWLLIVIWGPPNNIKKNCFNFVCP